MGRSLPAACSLQGFFRKRKTSNLEAYINWFNRLSYLVATEICMVGPPQHNGRESACPVTDRSPSQPAKKKQRARMIEFFIDVAQECFNIGNFNSLMAIISECCSQTHARTHARCQSPQNAA